MLGYRPDPRQGFASFGFRKGKSKTASSGGGNTGGGVTSRFMAAGNRIMTSHDTAFQVVEGQTAGSIKNQYQAFQQFLGIAGWDGYSPMGIHVNARNTNGRISLKSSASGGILPGFTIRKAGYLIVAPGGVNQITGAIDASKATFYPITYDGSPSKVVAAAAAADATSLNSVITSHDVMDNVRIPKGSFMFFQWAVEFAAVGDWFVPLVMAAAGYGFISSMGERIVQNNTPQDAVVGAPFPSGSSPSGGPLGLTGFFMKGCPNAEVKNVLLYDGDSIGQGASGPKFTHDGECFGFIKQGLNSPLGGGRKIFWDIGTFSSGLSRTSPLIWPESNADISWHFIVTRIIARLGNVPFGDIAIQHGHNDTASGIAAMMNNYKNLVDWFGVQYGIGKVGIQFGCSAYNTFANNTFGTTEADQTTNAGTTGAGTDFNAWLAAGAEGRVRYFVPSHTYIQNGTKFKEAGLNTATLLDAVAANAVSTVRLDKAMPVGALLVFEPGAAAGVADSSSYNVKAVRANANGGYDHDLASVNDFARRVQLAHAANSNVKETYLADNEHWSARGHAMVRDGWVADHKQKAFAA